MSPPEERIVPRFAAEPPHEDLPYGRWAQRLEGELREAWATIDTDGVDLGEPGEITWYPDRSWHGYRYVPATSLTTAGYELFGYVRFAPGGDGGEPNAFSAHGDFTDQTAERNPDWRLDLCDEVIGSWRGPGASQAAMTLVWGRALRAGGQVATAELGGVTVDQCALIDERFTLIAPDDYQHDLLEIKLWGGKGQELARESLYEGEEEDEGAEGGEASEDRNDREGGGVSIDREDGVAAE